MAQSAQTFHQSKPFLIIFILGVIGLSMLNLPPGLFLLLGLALSTVLHLDKAYLGKSSKWMLNVSIILMGFGLSLPQICTVGIHSFPATLIGITLALTAGFILTRLFGIEKKLGFLIATGTAICGGSAIAAMSDPLEADRQTIGKSTLVVFALNGVALFIFPIIGGWLHMGQHDFGLWSALAIHDTSSVVGAASTYGKEALDVAVTTKLVRSLWILPLALSVGFWRKSSNRRVRVPWFILGFIAAALLNGFIPSGTPAWGFLSQFGRNLLRGALFLIGLQMNLSELKNDGIPSLGMGVVLWFIVSVFSAAAIMYGLY